MFRLILIANSLQRLNTLRSITKTIDSNHYVNYRFCSYARDSSTPYVFDSYDYISYNLKNATFLFRIQVRPFRVIIYDVNWSAHPLQTLVKYTMDQLRLLLSDLGDFFKFLNRSAGHS